MDILKITVTPFVTNCFALIADDGSESVVVDPGEVTSTLLECVEGAPVARIVNTHGHCDHCAGNADLKRRTDAELLFHESDMPVLAMLEQQGAMFGWACEASPDPDRFLVEGDEVSVGAERLRVIHVPGHSPGHIALVGDGFVIAGDCLFAGSIGRTDLPGGDHAQLIDSIRTKLLALPDETVVYSGHGPETSIGAERRSNPFLVSP
ncbi:MAG: MBL fold metallo-hydrolase [bacterium]|nr:MBL fold metallo-hydrolase [bacterium]